MKNLGILLITIGFVLFSCSDKSKKKEDDENVPTQNQDDQLSAENYLKNLSPETKVFTWVDKLNVRNKPTTKGKVISSVRSKDAMLFTGEISDDFETIVLRGVAYYEPWLRVKIPDGQTGWVFGGAVKQIDEEKGNNPISDTNFTFPYFGKYNMENWKKKYIMGFNINNKLGNTGKKI